MTAKTPSKQILQCLNYFGPQDLTALTDNLNKRGSTVNLEAMKETLEVLVAERKVRFASGVFTSNVRVGGEE